MELASLRHASMPPAGSSSAAPLGCWCLIEEVLPKESSDQT